MNATHDDVRTVLRTALDLPATFFVDDLQYRVIEQWDSVAHMVLVAELEDRFDVLLDIDDVIDMSTYTKIVEILGKYGVDVE